MKIATTIGEMYPFSQSPAQAVAMYEGTGFRYLDYSFYDVVKTPDSPFLTDRWQEEILAAKTMAKQLGFTFVQAHAPSCALRGEGMDVGLLATIRSIEACGILGIKNMVIHAGFFYELKYPHDQRAYFRENAPFFKALIPAMEKNDVNILFENTASIFRRENCYHPISAKDLNALVAYMDHPLFGAAWDVGHAHVDGLDQYKQIMELGGNLKAIHVHDNDGTKDSHTAPFLGTVDFDSLMQGLIESNYSGYFTLEADFFFKRKRKTNGTGILANTPAEMKVDALSLLYKISKNILTQYNVFEE